MRYIICDESSTAGRFLVLGALVVPTHNHRMLTEELNTWKTQKGLNLASEFKWTKVSAKYLPLYRGMMEWLFSHLKADHARFRALVMDMKHPQYREFCEGERATGFYKAYYHLLLQCVKQVLLDDTGERALVLLDEKRERYPFHKEVLKKALNSALKRDNRVERCIANVEDRDSSGTRGEVLIQPVDILIGAIGFVRNGLAERPAANQWKRRLVEVIEREAGTRLCYDTMPRSAFSVWTFDLTLAMARKKRWKERGTKRKRPQA